MFTLSVWRINMKPTVKLVARDHQLLLTGFTDERLLPRLLMEALRASNVIHGYDVIKRRNKLDLVITLGGRLQIMNQLQRLAEEVSKAVRRPDAYDIWLKGGRAVDLEKALHLLDIEIREHGRKTRRQRVT